MDCFLKIAEGVMTAPVLLALARNPQLWNEDRMRTTFEGTPHAEVDDILLRFGSADGDDLEAADRPAMRTHPLLKEMPLNLLHMVKGSRLGRIVITRLEPGRGILPHADVMGEYARYYTRFHLVLQGLPGSNFTCGGETVNMVTGDIWWFDASREHSLANNSADDRIHMLIDVRIDP